MDDHSLLAECRTHLIVTSVHVAREGNRNNDIDPDWRKRLVEHQQEIVGVFADNSLPWADKYAVPASLIMSVLTQVQTVVQKKRELEQRIEPGIRHQFAVSMEYDPVPHSRDFAMLPEAIRAGFMRFNDARQVERFYAGRDKLFGKMHSTACGFHTRLHEFHTKLEDKTSKHVTLRAVWLEPIPKYVAVLDAINFGGEPRLGQLVEVAGPLRTLTVEKLRKDRAVRLEAIEALGNLAGLLHHYIMPQEDENDDGQEAA